MVEGQRWILFEAQRDVAEQKLGVGIGLAGQRAVLVGDAVGEIGVAAGEQLPGDDLALVPPGRGMHRIARIGLQHRRRLVGHAAFARPAHLLVAQAGVGAQLNRNPGDEGLGRRKLSGEREPRQG